MLDLIKIAWYQFDNTNMVISSLHSKSWRPNRNFIKPKMISGYPSTLAMQANLSVCVFMDEGVCTPLDSFLWGMKQGKAIRPEVIRTKSIPGQGKVLMQHNARYMLVIMCCTCISIPLFSPELGPYCPTPIGRLTSEATDCGLYIQTPSVHLLPYTIIFGRAK